MGRKSQKTHAKGVPTSAGSRKHKFGAMFDRTAQRKLKNILRDHGRAAAEQWATEHNALLALSRLTREG